MQMGYKIWLEENGHVFGDGLAALLESIAQHGSIYQAARHLKMSYRYAWGTVRKAEERLGYRLLTKHVGGEGGGGAELTLAGKELLDKYLAFRAAADTEMKRLFELYFPAG
ncbi:MAG: winged helix-turn-helix domain-containing protein [bacterium]